MTSLPVGTFVEVIHAKGVSQVYVVTNAEPIELRLATAWERFRKHWFAGRCRTGEMAAACDAIYAIESAMKAKA